MKLTDLPPEMLAHIFTFLPEKNFFSTALVNKQWHYFSYDGIEKKLLRKLLREKAAICTKLQVVETLKKNDVSVALYSHGKPVLFSSLKSRADSIDSASNKISNIKSRFNLDSVENQTQTDSADSPPPQTSSPRCKP